MRSKFLFMLFLGLAIAFPLSLRATPIALVGGVTPVQPNIDVNGYYSMNKARRGLTIQAAVVMSIPGGYHVNSNKPGAKYLIPTSVTIEAPAGVRVGAVTYPRAITRSFKFSEQKLSVYEGRAIMRFTVTVPANYADGRLELKARIRYQSCNDEVCFAPTSRDTSMGIDVVAANESVRRANGNIFGGK